jgi:hypothetical protein
MMRKNKKDHLLTLEDLEKQCEKVLMLSKLLFSTTFKKKNLILTSTKKHIIYIYQWVLLQRMDLPLVHLSSQH